MRIEKILACFDGGEKVFGVDKVGDACVFLDIALGKGANAAVISATHDARLVDG